LVENLTTFDEHFADRHQELERFRKSLAGESQRQIIVISAPAGMGKSWLLRQFHHEAQAAGARSVLIDFADGQAYDALLLLRRFRDGLGNADFQGLTRAIVEATEPRLRIDGTQPAGRPITVNVEAGGDAALGDVAGGNVIKDNNFVMQTDNPLVLQAMEDRITTAFFADLEQLTRQARVTCFFDSYERNTLHSSEWDASVADRWLRRELLGRIRDGQLSNVLVALAGDRLPEFRSEWNQVLGRLNLEPFTRADVEEYLRERRGLSDLSNDQVETLFKAAQGNPQLLGILGDNLAEEMRAHNDEIW
jgi:hypothetical protein